MARVLRGLAENKVFDYFEDLTQIPRPSYQEKAVSDYLVAFAKEHGFEYYQDQYYNVIIIKEASEGYEDVSPIILQGHMDMVCEKTHDCPKDMEKEGLDLYLDGDFIRARGTTLGGDDGIAVAYALAILDDDSLKHPRLEFVCTTAEETGMDGAFGIDVSMLKGHKLLNIDSEEEGVILASCAGGCKAEIHMDTERAQAAGECIALKLTGLTGGHSGVEIHKGRANGIHLLARVLLAVSKKMELRLITMSGGSKNNAIPNRAAAQVLIPAGQQAAFAALVEEQIKGAKSEYIVTDPDLTANVCESDSSLAPLTLAASKKVLALILAEPNGVQRMSTDIEGLTETSLNLGICDLDEKGLYMNYAVRTSVATALEPLTDKMVLIAQSLGARADISGRYPAWEYVRESALRQDMASIYREMFGEELKIEAIHAGVECGILAGKIDHLDAISMGPNIYDIHTPQEHLSISSSKRMYDFIVRVIACRD